MQLYLPIAEVSVDAFLLLGLGGFAGSALGGWVLAWMTHLGQIDLFVQLSYVLFLGLIGAMMFQESLRALWRARRVGGGAGGRAPIPTWGDGLPLKMKFRASGLYISVIPPLLVGALVGFMAAIMGVGGGFILVPAMIYLLGMPTKVVVGTSLFQIIFVTGFTTLMHAITNQTVDMLLALLLIAGGVIGAQMGTRVGVRLRAEQLRILLAILVLAVSFKIALDLLLQPSELYSITQGLLP